MIVDAELCQTCKGKHDGCYHDGTAWHCNSRDSGAYEMRAAEIKGLSTDARARLAAWIARVNGPRATALPRVAVDVTTERHTLTVNVPLPVVRRDTPSYWPDREWRVEKAIERDCVVATWNGGQMRVFGDVAPVLARLASKEARTPSPDATRIVKVGRGRPLFVRGPLVPWRQPQSA